MKLPADPERSQRYGELSARLRASDADVAAVELRRISREVRRSIVRMIDRARMGHIGGDLSVTDILVTCFWGALSLDPQRPTWRERDRFILSKGTAPRRCTPPWRTAASSAKRNLRRSWRRCPR